MKTFKTPKGTVLPLLDLRGKDYLQVQHRLVWFREEQPMWGIETEFLELSDKLAIAKATIKDASGRIIAQGTKSETPAGFGDFIEKAESGAIGRALAMCGFGTQFTTELDEGERIVDSPVDRTKPPQKPVAVPPLADKVDMSIKCFSFGKFKDMPFDTVGAHDLDNYCAYLRVDGKINGNRLKELMAAESFLKTREFKK